MIDVREKLLNIKKVLVEEGFAHKVKYLENYFILVDMFEEKPLLTRKELEKRFGDFGVNKLIRNAVIDTDSYEEFEIEDDFGTIKGKRNFYKLGRWDKILNNIRRRMDIKFDLLKVSEEEYLNSGLYLEVYDNNCERFIPTYSKRNSTLKKIKEQFGLDKIITKEEVMRSYNEGKISVSLARLMYKYEAFKLTNKKTKYLKDFRREKESLQKIFDVIGW